MFEANVDKNQWDYIQKTSQATASEQQNLKRGRGTDDDGGMEHEPDSLANGAGENSKTLVRTPKFALVPTTTTRNLTQP